MVVRHQWRCTYPGSSFVLSYAYTHFAFRRSKIHNMPTNGYSINSSDDVNRNVSSTNGSELTRDVPSGTQVHWNGNERRVPEDLRITIFADHGCPFAHRAYITLHELGLPYEDVLIDLNKPREPWYLNINPVSSSKTCFRLQNTRKALTARRAM